MAQSTLNYRSSSSPEIGLLVILIAFIIHTLLGMLLFLIEPTYSNLQNKAEVILIDTNTFHTIPDHATTSLSPVPHEEWGEMLARKNSFGDPLSQGMPSYSSPQQQNAQPTQEQSATPEEKKSALSENNLQLGQECSDAFTEKKRESRQEKNQVEQALVAAPINKPHQKDSSLDQKDTNDKESETPNQDASLQKKTLTQMYDVTPPKTSSHVSPVATSLAGSNAQTEKNLSIHPTQKTSQQTHAQPLTLASIGKGFLEQSKYDGTYDVTMLGKKGGTVNTEQIKIERYVAKLSWCLQNSFKLLRNTIDPHIPTETEVQVYLQLTPTGAISRLEILKSSGNTLLDKHTLAVFKEAGSSFPPVPSYIKASPFAIAYHIEYGIAQGNAPLSFSLIH